MSGGQSAARKNIRDITADVVFALNGRRFALGHEEGSDGGEGKLDLQVVEGRCEGGFERWSHQWLESFPREDDLAASEGLFGLGGR
jgi:hypothetical protein